ncbi:MAG: 3-hydroxyacyl-ACP dehydratase FabZ [Vampirovibrionales bacterium]
MIEDIQAILPHRYPFLMVDRVTKLVPTKSIEGFKNVTANEPFFEGHFPGKPIMPGVLIVEAMAQLGCILIHLMPEAKDKLILFAGIESVRFRRQVVPGDRLEMSAELLKIKGPLGKARGEAHVNGELAISGCFLFSLVPDNRELGAYDHH